MATVQGQPKQDTAINLDAINLPHRWDKQFPRQNGSATYNLQMPAQAPGLQELALYIPRVGNQANFYILQAGQRQRLISFGSLEDDGHDAAKIPHWIALPASMLQPGQPWQLEVTITAQSGRYGGLSSVHFGGSAELRPLYSRNHLWRQTSSQVIVLALGLLGFLAAGLWWRQRDASFGLFAITALLGMIRMGDRLISQNFLPWPVWGALMATVFAWHLLFMVRFSLQTTQTWSHWHQKSFALLLLGTAGAAFISFTLRQPWVWTTALMCLAVPGLYTFVRLIQRWREHPSHEALLLILCGLILIGVGLRDFLSVRLASSEQLSFSLLPIALFAFVLTMAWIIVERFSRQASDYKLLATSLELRVAERDAQLSQSYAQLKAKDQEQATLDERARIMRDIHDGVGAQLVGLVSMLKSGEKPPEMLREHAEATLDELRMAVDSLQPVEGSLSTVLATLRYRLGPRLQAVGIEIQWDVDELPRLDSLTPSAVLQVQRILLEAFTNVIRHAQASIVHVSARHLADSNSQGTHLSLCVDDNGMGSTAHQSSLGHGLTNMHWRAQTIGAKLSVETSPLGGTRVRLVWQLPRC